MSGFYLLHLLTIDLFHSLVAVARQLGVQLLFHVLFQVSGHVTKQEQKQQMAKVYCIRQKRTVERR